jgi:transcriptional regulator with XRE-family HTH domain
MSFGTFIRNKRLEKGYTLRKFSELIDISATYISRMERDEIDPPGEGKINAMANLLSIDPEQLVFMAGKLPSKVKTMVIDRPALVPLLRIASTKSDIDLQEMINFALFKRDKPNDSKQ